jgi:hypothetical protein
MLRFGKPVGSSGLSIIIFQVIFVWDGIDGRAINLKLNSSQLNQFLTKDTTYYYMDSYTSPCLDSTARCEAGFGLMVNLTLVDFPSAIANPNEFNDRAVLVSSGGDSPYSIGGFYLHQISMYGEKYLEFGVSIRLQLYVVKVTGRKTFKN